MGAPGPWLAVPMQIWVLPLLALTRACLWAFRIHATPASDTAEVQKQVMAAVEFGFSFPDLYAEVLGVIEATANNYSSMCQDFVAGRRTEIESINGYICARGEEAGIATPLNRALVDAVLAA